MHVGTWFVPSGGKICLEKRRRLHRDVYGGCTNGYERGRRDDEKLDEDEVDEQVEVDDETKDIGTQKTFVTRHSIRHEEHTPFHTLEDFFRRFDPVVHHFGHFYVSSMTLA